MGNGLFSLIIAGGAFCGSHVLLSSTRLRGSLRDQLGERGFLAVYSVTALVIFAWFVSAYAGAPTIVLWPRQRWTAFVPVKALQQPSPGLGRWHRALISNRRHHEIDRACFGRQGLRRDSAGAKRSAGSFSKTSSLCDSPLEGSGFELPVPRCALIASSTALVAA